LEGKLQRAEKLVLGLAGEKSRWEASIGNLEQQIGRLPGDCLVAAAFLSYAGPFPSEYREELVKRTWLDQVGAYEVVWVLNQLFTFQSFGRMGKSQMLVRSGSTWLRDMNRERNVEGNEKANLGKGLQKGNLAVGQKFYILEAPLEISVRFPKSIARVIQILWKREERPPLSTMMLSAVLHDHSSVRSLEVLLANRSTSRVPFKIDPQLQELK
jgi:hypothetical protein